MLHGIAFNPAINALYCSYYDFSCAFSRFYYLFYIFSFYGVYLHLCGQQAYIYDYLPFISLSLSAPYPIFITTLIRELR